MKVRQEYHSGKSGGADHATSSGASGAAAVISCENPKRFGAERQSDQVKAARPAHAERLDVGQKQFKE